MPNQSIIVSLIGAVLFVASSAVAHAASSEWFETTGVKMRLIVQPSETSDEIVGALDVHLEDGWKTYWRNPGSSGIPLQLDFSQSQNIASAETDFPTPRLLPTPSGDVVGYEKHVVFPIRFKLGAQSGSATPFFSIESSVLIGICADICIPVQAQFRIDHTQLTSSSFDELSVLRQGRAALPKPFHEAQHIVAAEPAEGRRVLEVITRIPQTASNTELYAEGPPLWYVPPAKLVSRSGGLALFELDLGDVPKDADVTKTSLRFTLVADGQGIEQNFTPAAK
ncbi:MAG: protein-disulfide reductase DsbD domain-containing protein [Pseudomonadota bacterium]